MLIRNVELLGTPGCHLCDVAHDVLSRFNVAMRAHQFALNVVSVDVSNSEVMVARYGDKIPVLVDVSSKNELDWPFDEERIYQFLRQCDRTS